MSRRARPEDIDEICASLPETEVDPVTGETYDDLVIVAPTEADQADARAHRAPQRLVREHLDG